MPSIVVNVEDLIGPHGPPKPPSADGNGDPAGDDDMLVEFTDGSPAELRAGYRKLWGMVLLMAVRDRAASVHYHPWRGAGALSYVVDNTRYEMVPPPAEFADACVDVAREAFTVPAGLLARLAGGRTACGTVSLLVGGNPILWDAVVWSNGDRSGVELFRITPLEEPHATQ